VGDVPASRKGIDDSNVCIYYMYAYLGPSISFSQEDLDTVSLAASQSLVEPEQGHYSTII